MASDYGSDDDVISVYSVIEEDKKDEKEEEHEQEPIEEFFDFKKIVEFWTGKYIQDCSNDKWFKIKVQRKKSRK